MSLSAGIRTKTVRHLSVKTTPYKVSSIKADYTLYAKFKIINLNLKVYSVTEGKIDGAGGTVQLGADTPAAKIETTVEWGTLATLTAKANANYEFKGWFTDPQCSIKADSKILNNCQYTDKTVETAAIKKDLTLYAKFSDVSSRKVTANAVFGGNIVDTAGTVKAGDSPEGATSTAVVTNGNSVTLVANTKPNYKFMGWYSDRELYKVCMHRNNSLFLQMSIPIANTTHCLSCSRFQSKQLLTVIQ